MPRRAGRSRSRVSPGRVARGPPRRPTAAPGPSPSARPPAPRTRSSARPGTDRSSPRGRRAAPRPAVRACPTSAAPARPWTGRPTARPARPATGRRPPRPSERPRPAVVRARPPPDRRAARSTRRSASDRDRAAASGCAASRRLADGPGAARSAATVGAPSPAPLRPRRPAGPVPAGAPGPRPRTIPWTSGPAAAAAARTAPEPPAGDGREGPDDEDELGGAMRRARVLTRGPRLETGVAAPGQNDEKTPPKRGLSDEKSGGVLLSQGVSPQVPSALAGLTSVFGMGTGVTPPLWPPKSVVKGDAARRRSSPRELHSEHEHHCQSKPSAD